MVSETDKAYMHAALGLARRGLGRVWPNPAVGCVLVKQDIVVGRGWTGDGGRPHAETQAIAQAGYEAKGSTAYVTLEPCCHEGKTPPCTRALIAAGVKRVVVACKDPDKRVSGQGLAELSAAGIEVVSGVLEQEALELNKGFILRVTQNRPLVTLKTATSKDGKIAPARGERQWITGPLSRARVHLERSLHDAVLAGVGTVLVDDPSLTARLPEYDHKTVRVILDTHLRISPDSQLVKTAKGYPLWIFHGGVAGERGAKLEKAGAKLFACDPNNIPAILNRLAEEGITRLLVEGGARVHTSFLTSGLYDRFLWFRAPLVMGAGAVDALEGRNIANIEADFSLRRHKTMSFGEDLLEIYGRKA